jgi:VanZ family protein
MSLSRTHIILFRLFLVVSVITVTYLATTRLDYPVVQDINDKLGHTLAFYFLALFLDFSFPHSKFNLYKITPLLLYGLLIEGVQYLLPSRSCEFIDFAADAAGVLIYVLSLPLLRRASFLKQRWGGDV